MPDKNTHSKLEGPLGRRFAKFAQLILTHYDNRSRVFPDSLLVKAARQETE
jgi:hypothetical protein